MLSLYEMGARVPFGEFAGATLSLVQAIASRARVSTKVRLAASQTDSANVQMSNGEIVLGLPAVAPDTIVSGDFAKSMLAFLLHEVGHIVYTSIGTQQSNQNNAANNYGDAGAGVMNVIEDYYVENAACTEPDIFPSQTGALLGRHNDELQDDVPATVAEAAASGDQLAQAYGLILASLNRRGVQGNALAGMKQQAEREAHPQVVALVNAALDKLDQFLISDRARMKRGGVSRDTLRANGTADRLRVSYQLIADLLALKPEEPQQPQQQPQQQPDKGQGKGQDKQPKQDKQDKQDKADADDADGEDEGEGAEGEGEGEGQGNGNGNGDGDGETDSQSQGSKGAGATVGKPGSAIIDPRGDRAAALMSGKTPKQTQAQRDEAKAVLPYIGGNILDAAKGKGAHPADPDKTPPGDHSPVGNVIAAAALADARRFADAARRALKAEDTVTVSRRLQTGRMDRRAITRAALGAHDVMARRRLDEGVRTAVVVMVDQSGSMSTAVKVGAHVMGRDAAVSGMAAVIVPAIERAGAAVALAGFTDQFAGYVSVHKDWNERTPDANALLKRVGLMDSIGGTPMIRPALWSEAKVMQQQATRHVVIWLCDGGPSMGELPALRAIFNRKGGRVEHFGIGLQCSLGGLFEADRHVVVQEMAKLAQAFETLLIPKAGRR